VNNKKLSENKNSYIYSFNNSNTAYKPKSTAYKQWINDIDRDMIATEENNCL
jgi:hypothetical protein